MNNRLRIVVIFITALTWLAAAAIFGLPKTLFDASRPFLVAISVAGIVFLLYENFFWRLPIVRKHLADIPVLIGVWRVEIRSTWIDRDTGEAVDPISGFAQIDQTASTFCMRIFTEEARSKTVAFAFADDQGVYRLRVVYENQPNIHVRARKSAYHQGSSAFHMRGPKPERFLGEYWTEHQSTGTIDFLERRSGEIDSFKDGELIFQDSAS